MGPFFSERNFASSPFFSSPDHRAVLRDNATLELTTPTVVGTSLETLAQGENSRQKLAARSDLTRSPIPDAYYESFLSVAAQAEPRT